MDEKLSPSIRQVVYRVFFSSRVHTVHLSLSPLRSNVTDQRLWPVEMSKAGARISSPTFVRLDRTGVPRALWSWFNGKIIKVSLCCCHCRCYCCSAGIRMRWKIVPRWTVQLKEKGHKKNIYIGEKYWSVTSSFAFILLVLLNGAVP